MTDDPTRIRNQPALTTSTGRIWLIVGGLFTAISLGVLIPMTALEPRGVALMAAIADVLLYIVIVIARLAIAPGRRRLGVMAIALLAIAAVSLVAVYIVAFAAA
jgi:hypothetical protein